MEKRIELEKRGRNPSEISELNLDNCRSTQIVGLNEEFSNLEQLSLINVGLTSLKGFPKLPNLTMLELSDNRISGGLNMLNGSPKLTFLNLSGNKISTIEALEPLKEFKNLKRLDLYNCEVTTTEDYRDKVFALLPNLSYLDGFNKDYDEESDLEGEENGKCEDGDEDDDEEEEEGEVGLSYLQNSIDEESDEEDYNPEGVDDSDEDIEDDADEEDHPRGQKRKLEAEEEEEDDDDD